MTASGGDSPSCPSQAAAHYSPWARRWPGWPDAASIHRLEGPGGTGGEEDEGLSSRREFWVFRTPPLSLGLSWRDRTPEAHAGIRVDQGIDVNPLTPSPSPH